MPGHPDLKAAVVAVCYPADHKLTQSEWGRVGKAVKELAEVDATPEQVLAFAAEYHRRYRDAALTPQAITNNWGSAGAAPSLQMPPGALRQFVTATWPQAQAWPDYVWDVWKRELRAGRFTGDDVMLAVRSIARSGQPHPPTWGQVWQAAKLRRDDLAEGG